MQSTVSLAPATAWSDDRPLSGLGEFFRYHGAWAPGVRLFRAIGFRAKALVISAVFLVPIAVLSSAYLADKATAIAFSAKERVGVAYVQGTLPLLKELSRLRAQVITGTAADGAALQQALKTAADAHALHGAELDLRAPWDDLNARLKALPTGGDRLAALKAFDDTTGALVSLIVAAADNSNLTLDPDLDSYYLMDASTAALPSLVAATASLRDHALAVAVGQERTPAFDRRMFEQEVTADLNDERWSVANRKVTQVHAGFSKTAQVEVAQRAMHAFHELAGSGAPAPRVVAEGQAALDLLHASHEHTLKKLDGLLAARVDALEHNRAIVVTVLLGSLALALYVFVCFRKVLEGGLTEVAFHIDAMRGGDLTTRPRAWGNDEAARLMVTLSQMQGELRRIVSQVRSASDEIVNSSTEIAGGAADLSQRTEQSAANLEETAAAMEQITATVRQNAETVDKATQLAGANAEAAERGGQIIGEVMTTMQRINDSSARIGDIIGTIDGIAFQTNILALNAAVEAARAGEQGRGFAVVASEVRALAQRSSSAAKEIKALITASVEQVGTGVRITQQASTSMGEVVSSSGRVRQLLAEVAVGAREQTSGVQQSSKAVQELDNVTQQNAALVEQTAAAAGALQSQARGLANEVSQFKLPA